MFDMFAPEFPGCGWGGPSSRPARETTCVSPRIAYNAAAGVKRASRARAPSLFRCDGGFLTWAAKPSVSKSPTPPKIPVNFLPESPLPRPSNSLWLKYAIADLKVPSCDFILRMIGRCEPSLGSKKGFVEASSFLGMDRFRTVDVCLCSAICGYFNSLLMKMSGGLLVWRGHSCPRTARSARNVPGVSIRPTQASSASSPRRGAELKRTFLLVVRLCGQECPRHTSSRCKDLVGVAVLSFDGPDRSLIFLERIDVDHPVEDHRQEPSTGCITRFLRVDRSLKSKLRIRA